VLTRRKGEGEEEDEEEEGDMGSKGAFFVRLFTRSSSSRDKP